MQIIPPAQILRLKRSPSVWEVSRVCGSNSIMKMKLTMWSHLQQQFKTAKDEVSGSEYQYCTSGTSKQWQVANPCQMRPTPPPGTHPCGPQCQLTLRIQNTATVVTGKKKILTKLNLRTRVWAYNTRHSFILHILIVYDLWIYSRIFFITFLFLFFFLLKRNSFKNVKTLLLIWRFCSSTESITLQCEGCILIYANKMYL